MFGLETSPHSMKVGGITFEASGLSFYYIGARSPCCDTHFDAAAVPGLRAYCAYCHREYPGACSIVFSTSIVSPTGWVSDILDALTDLSPLEVEILASEAGPKLQPMLAAYSVETTRRMIDTVRRIR